MHHMVRDELHGCLHSRRAFADLRAHSLRPAIRTQTLCHLHRHLDNWFCTRYTRNTLTSSSRLPLIGLPCLTNDEIVEYNSNFHYCIYSLTLSGYKFYTYLILLGWLLPSLLTWYAYVRILMIIYHSPMVFEALGLFKSRWLALVFIIT